MYCMHLCMHDTRNYSKFVAEYHQKNVCVYVRIYVYIRVGRLNLEPQSKQLRPKFGKVQPF
jgi:hypothetical protein